MSNFRVMICGVAALASAGAHAQGAGDAAEIRDLLARDGEWVLERWETFMGSSTDCKAGMSYVFAAPDDLTIKECIDQETVTSQSGWSVDGTQSGAAITLDGARYGVADMNEDMIILVRRDGATGEVVEELELVFLED